MYIIKGKKVTKNTEKFQIVNRGAYKLLDCGHYHKCYTKKNDVAKK